MGCKLGKKIGCMTGTKRVVADLKNKNNQNHLTLHLDSGPMGTSTSASCLYN